MRRVEALPLCSDFIHDVKGCVGCLSGDSFCFASPVRAMTASNDYSALVELADADVSVYHEVQQLLGIDAIIVHVGRHYDLIPIGALHASCPSIYSLEARPPPAGSFHIFIGVGRFSLTSYKRLASRRRSYLVS